MVAIPWIAAAIAAVGAVRSAQAQHDSAAYNATVAQQNAFSAEQQANAADQMLKRQQEQRMGAAVAEYGASGVDLSSGSASDVLGESARNATLDRLTQKYNYRMKALGYRDEASLDQSNASYASSAGYLNAASAALSAYSSTTKFG